MYPENKAGKSKASPRDGRSGVRGLGIPKGRAPARLSPIPSITWGFRASCGTQRPSQHSPPALQGVPSAQGKLPFLVWQRGSPLSVLHQSWAQMSSSVVLGQCWNSLPKICWHCWSRLYRGPRPGSSAGRARGSAGASSKQSPGQGARIRLEMHQGLTPGTAPSRAPQTSACGLI